MKLKQEGRITYSELYGYVMDNMRKAKKAKTLPSFGAVQYLENLEGANTLMQMHGLSLLRLRAMAYNYGEQFL